ncbi:hypothetical protein OROHE_023716 [Orobanche hederae]
MSTSTSTTAELVGGSGGSGGGIVSDVPAGSSRSGELTRPRWEEEKDVAANCLILLAKGRIQKPAAAVLAAEVTAEGNNYKCQTCRRSFPSFQALGGHRASHNKKLIYKYKPTRAVDESSPFSSHGESTKLTLQIPSGISGCPQNKTNIRVHGCSMCRAEFSSGQALGGHMRRHRPLPNAAVGSHGESRDQAKRPRTILSLDLNLPAPEDNHHENKQENMFSFVAVSMVTSEKFSMTLG